MNVPYFCKTYRQQDPEYLLSLILRYKILRIPLGLTFSKKDLQQDVHDTHIGLFDGDTLLACLILTFSGDKKVKMRQVAVDEPFQGKGIGSQLQQFTEQFIKEQGGELIYCHARETAVPFYLKHGYEIKGERFAEVGIPHFYMEKKI